ncbi:Histone-lysine N-methyltransferase SETMAR [Anthophora retusa]
METKRDLHLLFLYEFKLNRSAAQVSRNINHAFGDGSTNEKKCSILVPKISFWQFEYRQRASRKTTGPY